MKRPVEVVYFYFRKGTGGDIGIGRYSWTLAFELDPIGSLVANIAIISYENSRVTGWNATSHERVLGRSSDSLQTSWKSFPIPLGCTRACNQWYRDARSTWSHGNCNVETRISVEATLYRSILATGSVATLLQRAGALNSSGKRKHSEIRHWDEIRIIFITIVRNLKEIQWNCWVIEV